MPSLHFVGFLAHAIIIEDFSSTESLKSSVCRNYTAPAKVTLHKIHLNKMPKERKPDASKLEQVLVCKCSFVSMQQIISKWRSLIEHNLFIIILRQ